MHLDMHVVVTSVVTFVFTLPTMMDCLLPPLLSLYRLSVNAEEAHVGVDDDPPPFCVLPHLVLVFGPDCLEDLWAMDALVLTSVQSFVSIKSLYGRKFLSTV